MINHRDLPPIATHCGVEVIAYIVRSRVSVEFRVPSTATSRSLRQVSAPEWKVINDDAPAMELAGLQMDEAIDVFSDLSRQSPHYHRESSSWSGSRGNLKKSEQLGQKR
jgi:hypothetical protein